MIADDVGRNYQQATLSKLHEQQAEIQAIQDEAGRLLVTADFNGQWLDVAPEYQAGAWVDTQTLLGVLVDPSTWVVDAYVEQRVIDRIQPGRQRGFTLAVNPVR